MYRTLIEILPSNIKPASNNEQKIFVPFLAVYELHIVTLQTEALFTLPSEYKIESPFIIWSGNPKLDENDKLILYVDYFYKKSPSDPILQKMGDIIIEKFRSTCTEQNNKRKDIILKHWTNGLFAFDNGLYKEAVLNYGTIIEAILNTNLTRTSLRNLIDNIQADNILSSFKEKMHNVRVARNRVHANELAKLDDDIDSSEAYRCRKVIDEIISVIISNNMA